MEKIDNYEILKSVGKGGMGEVFLVYDPAYAREVALKRIKPELLKFPTIQERFLREAQIASQLTHPSIIPIHTIHKEKPNIYYTMAYIEGPTLKEILRKAVVDENSVGSSIPTLARIFLSICQAIAYIHSKGILHRDLKPENIIIGKFGEVMILDWGLADYVDRPLKDSSEDVPSLPDLTNPGKIVGTITFLAPERALGERSSFLTDIYALGAILYHMLTLKLPFKRTTLASYRKIMRHEVLTDPHEAAPYRDIPQQLADIAIKCLAYNKNLRYQTVNELIADLQKYIEGSPNWLLATELDVKNKYDWEFQENVLFAKHVAITRETEVMEWVSLMISKETFSGNTALETTITLGEESEGVGILLSIPEPTERKGLEEGYCLWIGSESQPGCKLYRSHVEVMHIPELFITPGVDWLVRIEKTTLNLRFFLNGQLMMNYTSNIPMTGTHVGLLYRDEDFQMQHLKVFLSAQNVMINCLSVPDAFLANKNYNKALSEYRRIGQCFLGRTEGREALFRAGITLLEKAITKKKKKERESLFTLAIEEFEKLHATPGAPLEYLGKSLVYKAENDIEEEIKCLELSLRKFPKHPLEPLLIEHIIFRLHESSQKNRLAAYHFALLAVRLLPSIFKNPDHRELIASLEKHCPPLDFLEHSKDNLLLSLAFWLDKPLLIMEMLEQKAQDPIFVSNALFTLLKLDTDISEFLSFADGERKTLLEIAALPVAKGLEAFFDVPRAKLSFIELRTLLHLFERAIDEEKSSLILLYFENLDSISLSDEMRYKLDCFFVWALLSKKQFSKAEKFFKLYPVESLQEENSPLFFLFGCYLWAVEGKEIALAHFEGLPEIPYPPIPSLLGAFLTGKIILRNWLPQAFLWEKIQLHKQLELFYQCVRKKKF